MRQKKVLNSENLVVGWVYLLKKSVKSKKSEKKLYKNLIKKLTHICKYNVRCKALNASNEALTFISLRLC
jgi:hypothetical protein